MPGLPRVRGAPYGSATRTYLGVMPGCQPSLIRPLRTIFGADPGYRGSLWCVGVHQNIDKPGSSQVIGAV